LEPIQPFASNPQLPFVFCNVIKVASMVALL
jgi:hypothetical protein